MRQKKKKKKKMVSEIKLIDGIRIGSLEEEGKFCQVVVLRWIYRRKWAIKTNGTPYNTK